MINQFDRKYFAQHLTESQNNQFIKPIYDYIDLSFEGKSDFIIVSKDNSKYGVLDLEGNRFIDFDYDYIRILKDNYIYVVEDKQEGLIDIEGNWILKLNYSKIAVTEIYNTGEYLNVSYKDGEEIRNIIVNNKSDEKITLDKGIDVYSYMNGIFLGKSGDLNAYINKKGEVIHSTKGRLRDFGDKYGKVSLANGKEYLVDKKGKTYLEDAEFDAIYTPIKNDYVVFYKDGSYGISDIEGKIKTKRDYGCIGEIIEGIAMACFKGKHTYLNLEGEEIVELGKYLKLYQFSDGLALVVKVKNN